MKKIILGLVMLFSITTNSQNEKLTGIWADFTGSDYYTVILNNKEEGFKFLNFSFGEQDIVQETFLNIKGDTIKTIVNNPDNNWKIYCEYKLIKDDLLKVIYSGDYNGIHYMNRKGIFDVKINN